MIHPHTELRYIGPHVGYGVVATRPIPKGTVTWALDALDRSFTPEEVDALDPIYQEILDVYTFRNNRGDYVLCWDNGRFVNHSFRANCLTTAYDFEVAIRDIAPGEQLTDDYGYLNIPRPFRAADEGARRKVVYPDDLVRHHRTWDRKVAAALKRTPALEQPLRAIIPDATWAEVERVARGEAEMQSVLSCYYDGTEAFGRKAAPTGALNGHGA